MANNNYSNYHVLVDDEMLERARELRRIGWVPDNRPRIFKPESRMMMERYYPDPLSAIREKIRMLDKQYMGSIPYVFKIHNSWVVSYPTGKWTGLSHNLGIFTTWADALWFANEVAARD